MHAHPTAAYEHQQQTNNNNNNNNNNTTTNNNSSQIPVIAAAAQAILEQNNATAAAYAANAFYRFQHNNTTTTTKYINTISSNTINGLWILFSFVYIESLIKFRSLNNNSNPYYLDLVNNQLIQFNNVLKSIFLFIALWYLNKFDSILVIQNHVFSSLSDQHNNHQSTTHFPHIEVNWILRIWSNLIWIFFIGFTFTTCNST